MKNKSLIALAFFTVLFVTGISVTANAHRRGWGGGYGYSPVRVRIAAPILPRVVIAPPVLPRVVVAPPAYGYNNGYAYGNGYGYNNPEYGYRGRRHEGYRREYRENRGYGRRRW